MTHPQLEQILESACGRSYGEESVDVDSRSIREVLASGPGTAVISEYKPESPGTDYSAGNGPVEAAEQMVEAGTSAISVLTEEEYFGGSPDYLRDIRNAADVPVLRKDFILDERELDRVAADAVLLIARFLDGDQHEDLDYMVDAARERGMESLVEVHNYSELDYALDSGAEIIGINNRDLGNLEVDISTFEDLAEEVPDDKILVAESGMETAGDVERMRDAGADAVLIGSSIIQSNDIYSKTRGFVEAGSQE